MPRTKDGKPTPKQLKRLISQCSKTIEEYNAKGWGDPDRLQAARTNLHKAEVALESGAYDDAYQPFTAAMDYLTSMGKAAVDDLRTRLA